MGLATHIEALCLIANPSPPPLVPTPTKYVYMRYFFAGDQEPINRLQLNHSEPPRWEPIDHAELEYWTAFLDAPHVGDLTKGH